MLSKAYQALLFALFFTLSSISGSAQSWIVEEAYGGNLNDRGYDLVAQANGNVTHIGLTDSYGSGLTTPNVHIVQSDPVGTTLWETVYSVRVATAANSPVNKTEMSIHECGNGDFIWTTAIKQNIAAQTDIIVMRVSSIGVPIWTKFIGGNNNGNDFSTSIIETPTNGDILITGYTNAPPTAGGYDALVARFNSAGALLWSSRYGGGGDDIGRCIRELATGNFVVVGETKSFTQSMDGLQFAISGIGAVVWSYRHGLANNDESFNSVMEHPNGNIYACGFAWNLAGTSDVWAVRSNAISGAFIQGRTYSASNGGREGAWSIAKSAVANRMVLTGVVPGLIGGTSDGFFLEIRPNLALGTNYRAYGTVFDDELRKIAYTPGRPVGYTPSTAPGYWCIGWTDGASGGNYDHYRLRTNLLGKTGCDLISNITPTPLSTSAVITLTQNANLNSVFGTVPTTTTLSLIPLCPGAFVAPFAAKEGAEVQDNSSDMSLLTAAVYPQPVRINSEFTLNVHSTRTERLHVTISDLQGRKVYSSRHQVHSGQNSLKLMPTKLNSGMYLLQISGLDGMSTLPVMFVD